jgi:hypothetical protein
LETLLSNINGLNPLFQHIKENGIETKIENVWHIIYKKLKIIDFNGEKQITKQEISRKPHDGSILFYNQKYGGRYKKCGTYEKK